MVTGRRIRIVWCSVRLPPRLTHHGVDRVYDWSDMPPGDTLGWGLNDASMFARAVEIIGTQQAPFFAEILSLSNHFPFETYPTDAACPQVKGSTTYRAYTHGIFYTDSALRQFFAAARQQPWFGNTMFIITGDHGIFLFPDAPHLTQAQRQEAAFRLPLLMYAPGLIPAGRRSVVGSQIDVAPTLLDLLRLRTANTFASARGCGAARRCGYGRALAAGPRLSSGGRGSVRAARRPTAENRTARTEASPPG